MKNFVTLQLAKIAPVLSSSQKLGSSLSKNKIVYLNLWIPAYAGMKQQKAPPSTINQKPLHMSPRFHLSSMGGNGVLAVRKQSGRYENGLTLSAGFTLVELAIVIVIIGLLVGGVMQGQSLIRQSKVTKVTSSMESYKSAINMFNSKYNCLPGDCPNATNFMQGTTNGDGNKIINANTENVLAWQHLGLSNMIKGNYSGTGTLMWGHIILQPSINSPIIFDSVTSQFFSVVNNLGWTNTDGNGIHHIIFGTVNSTLNPHNWQPFLTSDEAYSIDTKSDDGLPGKGWIRPHSRQTSMNNLNCTNSTDATVSTYQVQNSGINCQLNFLLYGL